MVSLEASSLTLAENKEFWQFFTKNTTKSYLFLGSPDTQAMAKHSNTPGAPNWWLSVFCLRGNCYPILLAFDIRQNAEEGKEQWSLEFHLSQFKVTTHIVYHSANLCFFSFSCGQMDLAGHLVDGKNNVFPFSIFKVG